MKLFRCGQELGCSEYREGCCTGFVKINNSGFYKTFFENRESDCGYTEAQNLKLKEIALLEKIAKEVEL